MPSPVATAARAGAATATASAPDGTDFIREGIRQIRSGRSCSACQIRSYHRAGSDSFGCGHGRHAQIRLAPESFRGKYTSPETARIRASPSMGWPPVGSQRVLDVLRRPFGVGFLELGELGSTLTAYNEISSTMANAAEMSIMSSVDNTPRNLTNLSSETHRT